MEAMRADGQALSYNFDEPSLASRALGLQLYTPLMLSKDNGNKGDDDPRYDLTAECDIAGSQHGRSCRWRSLLDMLDFGTLTFGWDWLYTNRTEDTPQRWMYPTTVVELGKGWVRGVERIITKVDGTFAFEASAARQFRGCAVAYFADGFKTRERRCGKSAAAAVVLGSDQLAVVVWG